MADEVYYVTPHLWNGNVKQFFLYGDKKIRNVDLNASDAFNIGITICYWNTHKQDKAIIYSNDEKIELDKLSDIEYLSFDLNNTLSIHKKGWGKTAIKMERVFLLLASKTNPILRRVRDDEFKYPVFSTSVHNFYYTNEVGMDKYGRDLFNTPKIMISRNRDIVPLFDRVGEYANTDMTNLIIDTIENLEIRHNQLQSNFAKFWFTTGCNTINNQRCGFSHLRAIQRFPDIPLSITTDDEIYKWLDLTENEIKVVEKYADLSRKKKFRHEKKV